MTRSHPHGGGPADPPGVEAPRRSAELPEFVTCPFCDGTDTKQFSAFGSAVSTSQYYCNDCRTVFEYLKWR